MNTAEHLYVISYDIGDPKRWRQLFKLMHGYGEWLQLSVFQCRLSARRHAELIALVNGIIKDGEDHVVMLDVGPADTVKPRVVSLGKSFSPVVREPTIV
jgi:CRISPR-associated protein Cas2